MIRLITFSLALLSTSLVFSQSSNAHKHPSYFLGIQARPIFPLGLVEPTNYSIGKNGMETRISQSSAFTLGGMIRMQFTDVFGLETGIHYTWRNYDIAASIPDSSIFIDGEMTFIGYEIPVNGLVSIQLSDQIFMTASMGASVFLRPTDASHYANAGERHRFLFSTLRKNTFAFGVNANLGFEYRTKKSGFFYFGGSASIPLKPIFEYEFIHEYDANVTTMFKDVDGAFLSLDLKYFFPIIENKGKQFMRGPIE